MAYALHNKPNVEAPSADYPYGRTKDKVANLQAGTPVNTLTHGDFHQFFSRLMAEAGVEENGQPDNNYSGFQLYQALLKTIAKKVGIFSNDDELSPAQPTNLNSFIYPGIFNVDAYSLDNDPGLDGPGQLIVGGNPDGAIIQRLIDLSNGAEWKRNGVVDNGTGTFAVWVLIRFAVKEVNIGSWNMPSEGSKTVAVGVSPGQIRKASARIFNDSNTGIVSLYEVSWFYLGVSLVFEVGGRFDNINYNSTEINRGVVTVEYDPTID